MLYVFGSCLFLCVLFFFVFRLFRKLKGIEENSLSSSNSPKRLRRVEEKSMSNNNTPQIKYDVFVSFRGEIRDGFLSHLIEAFKRNQINAFVDDRLEKGEEVGPSLVGAIEGSSISLIIFSQGYASSRWCLEELVTILECREKYGQTIIPVFYKVEPRHVRHQSSESYIDAFAKHEKKHESEVQKWRDALKTTAEISGIVSSNRNDAELVEEIVNLVLMTLTKPLVNSAPQIKYDVFVSYRSEICRRFLSHLVDTFKIKKINAFIVDKLESRTSPVEAIEASSVSLIIFSPNYASSYWCLEELVTILKCKEKYDRIVIPVFYNVEPTHVQHQSSHKYKNAFAKHGRKHNSQKVQIWREALNQSADLSRIESSKFQNDAELLKEIVNLVQVVLAMFDKPQCGSSKGFVGIDARIERPRISKSKGLKRAEEKHLSSDNKAPDIKYDVFVSFRGEICHRFLSHLVNAFERNHINALVDDRLQRGDEIGPSLVEAIEGSFISLIIFSPDYASSRWCLDELVTILECRKKYKRIVIPVFYYVKPTNVRHQSGSYENAFAEHDKKYETTKVKSWRDALHKCADISGIESANFRDDEGLIDKIVNDINLELKKLAKSRVDSKRLIVIDEKIATVESLIRKEPKDTRIVGIWGMGGIGKTTLLLNNFVNLKVVDLSGLSKLKKLPDLSIATNLEVLNIRMCESLHTIGKLPHSLKTLNVYSCTSLQTLPELPPLLETLDASCCKSLHTIGKLPHSLKILNVGSCTSLQTLPELPPLLETLETLDASWCESLHTIGKLPHSLKTLNVRSCTLLQTLPELPPLLETLDASCCKSLHTIGKLPHSLKILNVESCTSLQTLPELPPLLETLDAACANHFILLESSMT